MSGVKPPQDFAFFCDESSISGDRFTVVGGIIVHRNTIDKIHQNMAQYREVMNMKAELKWTKVSNKKYKEYCALVDYFFAMNNINQIQYHCLVFDSHTWDHKRYNAGERDTDLGLSRLYYQLIHHRFTKRCGPHGSLMVCLDHRNSSTSLNDLRDMLNAACIRDHGIKTRPVKQVISADSKQEIMLQINDVILGAVAAVRNGKHILATTREAKRNLGQLVLEKSGHQSFDDDTSRKSKFSIWNFESTKNDASPKRLPPKRATVFKPFS